jgi:hypothetical protein
VKHTNSTNSNTFSDEMEVDFHMLGALMLNGVGGEVNGADIIIVDEGVCKGWCSSCRSCCS